MIALVALGALYFQITQCLKTISYWIHRSHSSCSERGSRVWQFRHVELAVDVGYNAVRIFNDRSIAETEFPAAGSLRHAIDYLVVALELEVR